MSQVRAYKAPWADEVSLAIFEVNGRTRSVATSLTMTVIPEGQWFDPCVKLDKSEAQLLMDNLWDCGLRPSEGSGSAGQLAATQEHLKDMKKIAFDLLEKKNVR
jgi:hypothetical protein